ncbi:restriction endonuclease subunit S [Streptomyces microflavus]|uniref:Type I restriction modification DNA specificity domain-containing protein n=1 Tax=Streptomyces microflavus TaxID=1919 RepID=A0A7J0CY91_STRMI|nr:MULTISPECIES: restriction endonuclease subunit S [Streptomyces]MDX2975035.1 restriction endonuclease subunit S [Streptomyces sp. NRRL_B-2249]GFN07358.1 hypothetical protein Smic_59140 [Streptomyces microflavus]GGX62020.1 hypothetical protein GCM10010298_28300 [Streptomyces microflavus]
MRGEVSGQGAFSSWPAGWRRLSLAQAGKWLSGGTPATSNEAYWDGDIPWISGASMKEFHIKDSDRRVTQLGAKNGSRLVGKGTTLFVVRGMSLKSEFRIGVAERELAFGQDCKAVIPGDGIDPYFLAYAIKVRTPEILRMVEETSHGTGRLDTARLQELEIGIPSMSEQHRIVAAHAAFERRIAGLQGVLRKLGEADRSVVTQVILETRNRVPLGDWLDRIEAGKSPLVEDVPAGDSEWGVLKVSAVQAGWFKGIENKVVRTPDLINPQYEVRPGDLLMTRANTEQLVGLACVARHPAPRLMLSDKTLRLVPKSARAEVGFVELALLSFDVRRQIMAAATGTSGSMKNIAQTAVRQLLVPDVSVGTQRRIVAATAASRRRASSMRDQIAKLRTVRQGMVEDLLSGRVRLSA